MWQVVRTVCGRLLGQCVAVVRTVCGRLLGQCVAGC